MARKRKVAVRDCHPMSKDHTLALFGIVNYLPARPAGETDDTIADMIKIMVDESRRLKQNSTRVEDLMTQTFADRRSMIVTDLVSLSELKVRFPCLFSQEQVCFTSLIH